MLKREVEREILDWIKGSDRRCLMIDGVRQAGKTYIIRKELEETGLLTILSHSFPSSRTGSSREGRPSSSLTKCRNVLKSGLS